MAAPCVWCGSEESAPVVERRDRLGEDLFRYLRCCRCGLIHLEPLLPWKERVQHYPPGYEAYQDAPENWLLRLGLRRYWSRRVQAVHRFAPRSPGVVLDVGCATGGFLEAMRERGWQVYGVEPHPEAAARAAGRLGAAAVRAAPLEAVDFPSGSFDLITLWDVLDHLADPPAALRRIGRWLRPGGLLVLGLPYPGSWDAHLFGPAWLGWDAPRHLYLFPEETLREIVEGVGFQVIVARCFYGGYGSLVASLAVALRERLGEGQLGRFLRGLVHLRLWRYACWPYFRLAEWADRGPIRTYFCRPASPVPDHRLPI
jgi:SAM-dependent methyltransferase